MRWLLVALLGLPTAASAQSASDPETIALIARMTATTDERSSPMAA